MLVLSMAVSQSTIGTQYWNGRPDDQKLAECKHDDASLALATAAAQNVSPSSSGSWNAGRHADNRTNG